MSTHIEAFIGYAEKAVGVQREPTCVGWERGLSPMSEEMSARQGDRTGKDQCVHAACFMGSSLTLFQKQKVSRAKTNRFPSREVKPGKCPHNLTYPDLMGIL